MAPDQVLRFGFLILLVVFGKALADDHLELDSKTASDERNLTALCLVKFETGNCRASLSKWWYVAENQTCAEFIYGGCGGNGNNYDDEQKCLESCQGVSGSGKLNDASGISKRMTNLKAAQKSDGILEDEDLEEFCTVKYEVGPCRASLPRWYYSTEQQSCVHFIYGGCKGNKNNYMSEEGCMKKCSALSPEPLKNEEGDQFDYQESCAAAKVVGPCRASMPRWYFNAETHDCEPFIYGGCQGNKNNYMSKELCMEKCSEAENTSFDPLSFQFFHHSRTTDNPVYHPKLIACFNGSSIPRIILVGGAGLLALLLTTALVCFIIKIVMKKRATSVATTCTPADDKEYLLNNV